MKKTIIVIVLSFAAVGAFGATFAHNVDFGSYGFTVQDGSDLINTSMFGATYRYIFYPKDVGFYYGADVTMAFPTYRLTYRNGFWYGNGAIYAQAFYLMAPFGYRWPGAGKGSGFFLGGGPAIQFLYGINVETIVGLGVTAELGVETNMTTNTDFHFAFQFGWSSVFGAYRGFVSAVGFNGALRFGITWRRVQPPKAG